MRIHQLAKELDVKAKDIFPHLKKLGIEFTVELQKRRQREIKHDQDHHECQDKDYGRVGHGTADF